MNKRYLLRVLLWLMLLLVTFLSPLTAQEKPMITVLPFSSIEVPAYVSQIISQLFETNLVNTQSYDVLSQNERDQILAAQAESLSGCTDESCAIEIGRMLAAEQVILGTVAALGSKYIINAKIIDVTTSKTLGADMISAASVEELDSACQILTVSLVKKARPDIQVAAAPEPEPAPAPTPEPEAEAESAPEPTPEPLEEPEVAETPPPAPKPKPVRSPISGSFVPKILAAGGAVLQTAGNMTGAVSYTYLVDSYRAYQAYMEADYNPGLLYEYSEAGNSYGDLYESYAGTSNTAIALTGLGGAALGVYPFLQGGVSMSTLGKILHFAGLVSLAAGDLFGNLAVGGYTLTDDCYNDYMAAEYGIQDLWDRYENAYNEQYQTPRYTSFGLWGSAAAMMAASVFLPGDGTPATEGILNKILYAAGSLMLTGGNVTAMMSRSALTDSRMAYEDYESATIGLDSLWETYENTHYDYEVLTYTSYGLWFVGALLAAASLFIPGPSGADVAELPFGIEILPAPVGYGAAIHILTR